MRKTVSLLSFIFLLAGLFSFQPPNLTAQTVIAQMMDAARKTNTLKFTLVKQERIKGKLVAEKSNVKLQQKPLKVYLKQESPQAGMEVLYVTGQNNNEALVQTNSFPWKTLSLKPQNSLMRNGQHHTLLDMGFSQILNITEHLLEKYADKPDVLRLNKNVTWNGLTCYHLTLSNPQFKYVDYTVGKNENLVTIAARNKLSEYMILEKNPEIDDYTDVSAGQKIKIPTDYSREISIYIDQKTSLPVVIKVSDDKGLFEQYEYQKLQVNPAFKEAEFTRTFPGYKF